MKKHILLAVIIFSSCSEKTKKVNHDHQKEKAQQVISKNIDTVPTKRIVDKKKLQYLYYANGGLIGYFDDGTIVGCPKCDLLVENIEAMHSMKPIGKYTVRQDGSLLIGENEIEYPQQQNEDKFNEWAMIDYKWIVEPRRSK